MPVIFFQRARKPLDHSQCLKKTQHADKLTHESIKFSVSADRKRSFDGNLLIKELAKVGYDKDAFDNVLKCGGQLLLKSQCDVEYQVQM